MPTIPSSAARDARRRAYAFGLIADVLATAPSANLLAALRAPDAEQLFATHGIPFSIDALPGADGAKLFTWICEYDALFNDRGNPLLPFEAVYCHRDAHGQWGARAELVRAFADRWQLQPRPPGLRLDHAGVELRVMSELASREAELASRGEHGEASRARSAAATFARDHLAPWIHALRDDIASRARIFVYRDVMQIAVALVRYACYSSRSLAAPPEERLCT